MGVTLIAYRRGGPKVFQAVAICIRPIDRPAVLPRSWGMKTGHTDVRSTSLEP